MKTCILFFLTFALLLGGCSNRQSRETVFVLDVSQSIDADAEQQMFVVVEDAAKQLRRGDTLTIIPITGNAEAELQGRTLHYAVPSAENRQAYDADLRNLNVQIKEDLARVQVDAVAHPGKRTDIIGSVWAALKVFSERQTDKRLVVLSDFIQDDDQYNFRKDSRLATEEEAVTLGEGIAWPRVNHPFVQVVLGRLRSSEFSALAPTRQRAINAFWGQVMAPAEVNSDGTGAVRRSPPSR
jgi:hypothetical protein